MHTHFVMILLKNGTIDDVFEIFLVAFGEVQHGLCVSRRGVEQPFAIGILADTFQDSSSSIIPQFSLNCPALWRLDGKVGGGKKKKKRKKPTLQTVSSVSLPPLQE